MSQPIIEVTAAQRLDMEQDAEARKRLGDAVNVSERNCIKRVYNRPMSVMTLLAFYSQEQNRRCRGHGDPCIRRRITGNSSNRSTQ